MKNIIFILALLLFNMPAHADFLGLFGTDNYYECILDDMPGEYNPRTVTKIQQECRKKHAMNESVQRQRPFFGPHSISDCLNRYGSDYQQAGIIWIREACHKLYYP